MTQAPVAPTDVMARLRSETRPAHDATEAQSFGSDMLAGKLPKAAYLGQLRAYVEVHDALESALDESDQPSVQAIWSAERAKLHLLEEDLTALEARDLTLSPQTAKATQRMVTFINKTAAENSIALLGILYVLEGSTLGGQILRKHVTDMYELVDGMGVSYYTAYGDETGRYWHQFRSGMNETVTCSDEQTAVIAAAVETFNHIQNILASLHD